MPITNLKSITSNSVPRLNPDAELLALIERHDVLFPLYEADEESNISIAELCALELTIAATPAFTAAGLERKRRVIARASFDDVDGIVAEILRQDAERVGG